MSTSLRRCALFLAACAIVVPSIAAAGGVSVKAVADVGFTVGDLDESVSFFTEVLDFEKQSEVELAGPDVERRTGVFGARIRVATLRLGAETIELTDYLAPRGDPYPHDTRANDVWFQHLAIVVSDMDAAYARLRAARVEHASTGPQLLPDSLPAAAGIRAFYFRDPDGHFLELIQFPPGKGDARWQTDQAGKSRLFLGIDHTAIVVRNTQRALRFYRDRLGFAEVGAGENFGAEQEHLNNVEHAHLRITALRPPRGPGIELLEYLKPRDGRTPPRPIRANDLAFWRIRVEVDEMAGVASWAGVKEAAATASAFTIRDPDGHSIELWQGR
jgi:catechol 2,3-dioxygenase-like lactoylglutathione lyase family enzyme